ncbi:MAG: hypothetical protein FJ291_05380 [Planctomycetes bacterium]|nr:hypothetical protein [Planctomycetota bacterium]
MPMPDGTAFSPLPGRDACRAINGYIYQVNTTILRWLALTTEDMLFLESGEDVDIVERFLPGKGQGESRVLEQVKHSLSSKVTLNSAPVLRMIVNAVLHIDRNPGRELRFLFTTNATIGGERTPVFKGRKRALDVWERLRRGQVRGRVAQAFMTSLRRRLETLQRPQGCKARDWERFKTALARYSKERFLGLICHMEWNAGAPSARDIEKEVMSRLSGRVPSQDQRRTRELYDRLFLHVIRLLSRDGPKSLTPSELEEHVSLPTLTDSDQKMLADLTARVEATRRELNALDARVAGHEVRIERLEAQGHSIPRSMLAEEPSALQMEAARSREQPYQPGGTSFDLRPMLGHAAAPVLDDGTRVPAVEMAPRVLGTDPPPLVSPRSTRSKTVADLCAGARAHTWTALYGTAGCGKTQLVNLLVRCLGTRCLWVSFRDMDTETSWRYLVAALHSASGNPAIGMEAPTLTATCSSLGSGAILVFDDLPRLGGDRLSEALVRVAEACSASSVSVVSTSPYRLPAEVLSCLAPNSVRELLSPPLTDPEAREILSAYGSPGQLLASGIPALLNATAGQHPQLLCAIARYLVGRDWRVDMDELRGIWKGEHTGELTRETLTRVLETVADSKARDLLYRLNIVIGAFAEGDLLALSQVSPPVARPRELFHGLVGLWVQEAQEAGGARYLQSPLVKQLGTGDLSSQTEATCCRVLARRMLTRGTIGFPEGVHAIIYFLRAQDFASACVVLITGLSTVLFDKRLQHDFGLLFFWTSSPIPDSVPLQLRLHLRGLQVAVMDKLHKDDAFVLDDLLRLVGEASEREVVGLLGATAPAVLPVTRRAPHLGIRLLKKLFQAVGVSGLPEEVTRGRQWPFPLESFIWLAAHEIRTMEGLPDWVDLLESLTPDQLRAALGVGIAEDVTWWAFMRAWLDSHGKEEVAWRGYASRLQEIAERARAIGADIVWASAVRCQIIVLAEDLGELDNAIALAREALAVAPEDPGARFLVLECAGRQLYYKKHHAEARTYLAEALGIGTRSFHYIRFEALVMAGASASALGDHDLTPIDQAIGLARSGSELHRCCLVQALGEASLCLWALERPTEAFERLEEAARVLLGSKEDSEIWRRTFVLMGHVAGYLGALARLGAPPESTPLGEPYTAPSNGWFLNCNQRLESLYQPDSEAILEQLIAMLAKGLELEAPAALWATRALRTARATQQRFLVPMCLMDAIPSLLDNGAFQEVLESALEASKVMNAGCSLGREAVDYRVLSTPGFDTEAVLGPKGKDSWVAVAETATTWGLLPCLLATSSGVASSEEKIRVVALQLIGVVRNWVGEQIAPEMLREVVDALELAFVRKGTANEIRSALSASKVRGWVPSTGVYIIGYAARADADLRQVAGSHVSLAKFLYDRLDRRSSTYEKVVLAYFTEYWMRAFEAQKFRFHAPQLVEADLRNAVRVGTEYRMQAVLRCISDSLRISPPESIRTWLHPANIHAPLHVP